MKGRGEGSRCPVRRGEFLPVPTNSTGAAAGPQTGSPGTSQHCPAWGPGHGSQLGRLLSQRRPRVWTRSEWDPSMRGNPPAELWVRDGLCRRARLEPGSRRPDRAGAPEAGRPDPADGCPVQATPPSVRLPLTVRLRLVSGYSCAFAGRPPALERNSGVAAWSGGRVVGGSCGVTSPPRCAVLCRLGSSREAATSVQGSSASSDPGAEPRVVRWHRPGAVRAVSAPASPTLLSPCNHTVAAVACGPCSLVVTGPWRWLLSSLELVGARPHLPVLL